MKSVVTYVRSLFGWCDDKPTTTRTSFKRDRNDDELSSDDDVPAMKKLRHLRRTSYPDRVAANDIWSRDQESKNVRYVPIHVEPGHPSTSTPNVVPVKKASRIRTVPIKLVGVNENGETSPGTSKIYTSKRPVMHAVIDDDDEQVAWIERKPENPKTLYINFDDDDENNDKEDDDVIYVKKVSPPPPPKPYKFFYTKNNEIESRDEVDDVEYYRLKRIKDIGHTENMRNVSKLKGPVGITKSYKPVPTSLPRWMQSPKSNLSSVKNRYLNINGNARSTLSKVFDLEQKRSYRDLIMQATKNIKPVTLSRPIDIINLADDIASFRNTQKAQKKALNEIKTIEKDITVDKESDITTEYDPITIASINSSDSEVEVVQSDCSTSSSVKIDPINTMRASFQYKAICRPDWIAKIQSKYNKAEKETTEMVKDVQQESNIISKVNYEQKLAHLAHRLKYELSIPECLITEVQPEEELPKLTPEQEKLVDRALGPGPPGQLMIEKFNLRIHRRDLQTLAGLHWLNDEVINFYMNLLMQRSEQRPDLPKVYATNTFFYPKLMQSGQAGLRRWTRKVDIFAHDLMVVPVHLGVHWCLSIVDFRRKCIMYLDSMGTQNQPCLNALMQYLRDEHQDKKGQPFEDKGWTTRNLKDIPQQMNGSDCGMFACTFAEFSSRNAPYTFTQSHMPYMRKKAALEILQGRLLL